MFNRLIVTLQIMLILFIALYNGVFLVVIPNRAETFPCAEHQCGCKSASDCQTNCCCAAFMLEGKQGIEQVAHENSFSTVFLSSMNCLSGNDGFIVTAFNLKYIREGQVILQEKLFQYFTPVNNPSRLCTTTVPPPKKPPRYFT